MPFSCMFVCLCSWRACSTTSTSSWTLWLKATWGRWRGWGPNLYSLSVTWMMVWSHGLRMALSVSRLSSLKSMITVGFWIWVRRSCTSETTASSVEWIQCLWLIVSTGSEEAFRQSLEGLREQIVSDDVIFWCLHTHHCGLLTLDNVKKHPDTSSVKTAGDYWCCVNSDSGNELQINTVLDASFTFSHHS